MQPSSGGIEVTRVRKRNVITQLHKQRMECNSNVKMNCKEREKEKGGGDGAYCKTTNFSILLI